MIRIAILVDGAFYRKRAVALFGQKSPADRAAELKHYCDKHIRMCPKSESAFLYRVLYYDCPPSGKNMYHPLLGKEINLGKTDLFAWTHDFFRELKNKRKFALRMGRLAEEQASYAMKPDVVKRLMSGKITVGDLKENDFLIEMKQKGVDMRIGIDMVSMALKKQVDRIILIAGDSDFVPAAKFARREGIDFILDPMRAHIRPDLLEHIDALRTMVSNNVKTDEQEQ